MAENKGKRSMSFDLFPLEEGERPLVWFRRQQDSIADLAKAENRENWKKHIVAFCLREGYMSIVLG